MATEINVPASYQFAEDYFMVVENDFNAYTDIMERPETKAKNVSGLSDKLRAEFEQYIGEVVEREKENGHEIGSLLISQMLLNWGASSFDKIARHFIDLRQEK